MSFSSTVSITGTQKVTLHADCRDVCGMCMLSPSTPSWSNSDNAVATITPSGDNLSCDVIAVSAGFTDVTVTINSSSTITRVVVSGPVFNYIKVNADDPVSQ